VSELTQFSPKKHISICKNVNYFKSELELFSFKVRNIISSLPLADVGSLLHWIVVQYFHHRCIVIIPQTAAFLMSSIKRS
jgi:hypothetical protein